MPPPALIVHHTSVRFIEDLTKSLRGEAAVLMLCVCSVTISAGQHTAALKAHTVRTGQGLFTIGYEQAFNKHFSAELCLQGGYYINIRPNKLEDYEATGVAVIGALRYYPFAKAVIAPRGFFGYTALRYVRFHEDFHYLTTGISYEVGGTIKNIGVGIGYKFAYRRLGLEAFVGWGAGSLKSSDEAQRNNIPPYFRDAIAEQEHFPLLDVALCYMLSPLK